MVRRLTYILCTTILAFCSTGMKAQTELRDTLITFGMIEQPVDSLVTDSDFLYKYDPKDNLHVAVSAGVSISLSENTHKATIFESQRPSFQIEFGKYFYPSFGMRVTLGYKPQVGRAEWELADHNSIPTMVYKPYKDGTGKQVVTNPFGTYKFNVFSAYLDGLINLTTIILPYREHRFLNIVGILGIGYNRTFGFEESKLASWRQLQLESPQNPVPVYTADGKPVYAYRTHDDDALGNDASKGYEVDTRHYNYLAAHVGLQARFRVSDPIDFIFEATYNGTDDEYNGFVYNRVYDAYVDLQFSVLYHFKDQYNHNRFRFLNNTRAVKYENLTRALQRERKRAATNTSMVRKEVPIETLTEQLQTTISFYIDRYYITEAQKKNVKSVANFLEDHPDINLVITGYADVQTAYPQYNMRLSKKRATAVYDMLTKEFKVDPKRLRMEFKGDKEQPYSTVNEWNRAVVFRMESKDAKTTDSNVDNIYDIIKGGTVADSLVVIDNEQDIMKYRGNNKIHKVIIEEGITEIPDSAFQGCWGLREVVIPEGIKRIGKNAFNGTILQKVTLPATLDTIDDEAFLNSSIVEVDIPSGHKPLLGKRVFGATDRFIIRVKVPSSAIEKFRQDSEWRRCENITNIGAYWNK